MDCEWSDMIEFESDVKEFKDFNANGFLWFVGYK